MQAAYYKQAVVVIGDTTPWKENIKQLGGKYNHNLGGQSVWIFPKYKEADVVTFVNQANEGLIQPIPSAQRTPGPVAQLTPMIVVPRTPAPMIRLPPEIAVPTETFVGQDGLTYRIIQYMVPVPRVGQHLTITVGEFNLPYVVTHINSTGNIIDDILITEEVSQTGQELSTSRAVIVNGKWQVYGMQDEHTLTFS